MTITVWMQIITALWWTGTSCLGFLIAGPVMVRAYRGWAILYREGVDPGMTVMTWSHVQSDALRILMHLFFFTLGVSRLLGPPFTEIYAPNPLAYWLGTGAAMLVPVALIAMTLLEERARWKAARGRR